MADNSSEIIIWRGGMEEMNEMIYSMEGLLPLAAELAHKFTSGESTSVTYEKAQSLMEAVLYCIHVAEEGQLMRRDDCFADGERENYGNNEQSAAGEGDAYGGAAPAPEKKYAYDNPPTARNMYTYGYEKILDKCRRAQTAYNELTGYFCAYGNVNYHDTVLRAIPGFFQYYQSRLAPQETIITMDYPTLIPVDDATGICAVERYISYITLEQQFLRKLPREYVEEVLHTYQANYRLQFYNICEIVLQHILACLFLGRKPEIRGNKAEYEQLADLVERQGQECLAKQLEQLLWNLISNIYEGNIQLYTYLNSAIPDFACRLQMGGEAGTLEKIVVL